jgi:hypothetical protein
MNQASAPASAAAQSAGQGYLLGDLLIFSLQRVLIMNSRTHPPAKRSTRDETTTIFHVLCWAVGIQAMLMLSTRGGPDQRRATWLCIGQKARLAYLRQSLTCAGRGEIRYSNNDASPDLVEPTNQDAYQLAKRTKLQISHETPRPSRLWVMHLVYFASSAGPWTRIDKSSTK